MSQCNMFLAIGLAPRLGCAALFSSTAGTSSPSAPPPRLETRACRGRRRTESRPLRPRASGPVVAAPAAPWLAAGPASPPGGSLGGRSSAPGGRGPRPPAWTSAHWVAERREGPPPPLPTPGGGPAAQMRPGGEGHLSLRVIILMQGRSVSGCAPVGATDGAAQNPLQPFSGISQMGRGEARRVTRGRLTSSLAKLSCPPHRAPETAGRQRAPAVLTPGLEVRVGRADCRAPAKPQASRVREKRGGGSSVVEQQTCHLPAIVRSHR